MLPIRTILHPTDFSERAESAFLMASALARDYGADLIVLHVKEPGPILYSPGSMAIPDEPSDSALMEKLRELKPGDGKTYVEYELAEGKPAVEILRVANENDADLIVMGTHGRTGIKRLLMGSVAEYVVRKAFCPVLTIKEPFPEVLPVEEGKSETAPEPCHV